MIEIRDAAQADLDYVLTNPLENGLKYYPKLELNGYAKAGIVNGEVIGVGGIVMFYPGRGEAWAVLSEKVNNFKVEVLLCIKKILEQGVIDTGAKRLECSVREDFPKSRAMIEFLGFKCDTPEPLQFYCPDGASVRLYSKINSI